MSDDIFGGIDLDTLTIPNGFAINDDHLDIAVIYDGEDVTFLDEDDQIVTMGTLCYLDHVVGVCVRDVLDNTDGPSDESAALLGHTLASIIQHLHSQMHELQIAKQISELRASGGSGLGGLLAALAGGAVGIDGDALRPVGAFVMGPDGLQKLDMENPDALAAIFGADIPEDEAGQPDGDEDDSPTDEIIIGDIPRRK